MKRCVKLKNLEFRKSHVIEEIFIIPLYYLPGANHNLANLTSMTFDCSIYSCDQFLYELSHICKRIKTLSLSFPNDDLALAYFIESQESLEDLSIFTKKPFPTIENSLKKNARSLQRLASYGPISTKFLGSCVNLKILDINCENFFQRIDDFGNLKLTNLERMNISTSDAPTDQISRFILNTKRNLKQISLNTPLNNLKGLTLAIVNFCPNLVHFSGPFDNSSTSLLPEFVRICPFLEILRIVRDKEEEDSYNISKELKLLGDTISKNLKKIELKKNWIYDSESLYYFIGKCFERLKGPFEFNINTRNAHYWNFDKQIILKSWGDEFIINVKLLC